MHVLVEGLNLEDLSGFHPKDMGHGIHSMNCHESSPKLLTTPCPATPKEKLIYSAIADGRVKALATRPLILDPYTRYGLLILQAFTISFSLLQGLPPLPYIPPLAIGSLLALFKTALAFMAAHASSSLDRLFHKSLGLSQGDHDLALARSRRSVRPARSWYSSFQARHWTWQLAVVGSEILCLAAQQENAYVRWGALGAHFIAMRCGGQRMSFSTLYYCRGQDACALGLWFLYEFYMSGGGLDIHELFCVCCFLPVHVAAPLGLAMLVTSHAHIDLLRMSTINASDFRFFGFLSILLSTAAVPNDAVLVAIILMSQLGHLINKDASPLLVEISVTSSTTDGEEETPAPAVPTTPVACHTLSQLSDGSTEFLHRFEGKWTVDKEISDRLEDVSRMMGVPYAVRVAIEKFTPQNSYKFNWPFLEITTFLPARQTRRVLIRCDGLRHAQGEASVGDFESLSHCVDHVLYTSQHRSADGLHLEETRTLITSWTSDGLPNYSKDILWYRVTATRGSESKAIVNRYFRRAEGVPSNTSELPDMRSSISARRKMSIEPCAPVQKEMDYQREVPLKDENREPLPPSPPRGEHRATESYRDIVATPGGSLVSGMTLIEEASLTKKTVEVAVQRLKRIYLTDHSSLNPTVIVEAHLTMTLVPSSPPIGISKSFAPGVTPQEVVDYLWQVPPPTEYDPLMVSCTRLSTLTPTEIVIHQSFKGRWGFWGRDFIMGVAYVHGLTDKGVLCKQDPCTCGGDRLVAAASFDGAPPHKDFVRGRAETAGFYLKSVDEGTEIVFINQCDLISRGIPDWVLSGVRKEQLTVPKNLRKILMRQ